MGERKIVFGTIRFTFNEPNLTVYDRKFTLNVTNFVSFEPTLAFCVLNLVVCVLNIIICVLMLTFCVLMLIISVLMGVIKMPTI